MPILSLRQKRVKVKLLLNSKKFKSLADCNNDYLEEKIDVVVTQDS
jgi:hypothetical protein